MTVSARRPISSLLLALALAACSGGEAGAAVQRVEDLVKWEARLVDLERELAAREAELTERGGELAGLAETLDRRRQEQSAREAGAAETLDRRQKEIATREAELAAIEAHWGRQAADVEARQAAVEAAESRLAEDRRELEDRRAELDRREARQAAARGEAERRGRETFRRPPPAAWIEAALPAGTLFDVEFLSTLSSGASRPGERFRARLVDDLYTADGTLAVGAGTQLAGTVLEAVPLKKVGGQARLALSFDRLLLPSGEAVAISASFYGENREGRRDAATIGSAALNGALIGRAIGRNHEARATLLGAILGAAAGTAAAAGGEEVVVPAGARVTLELDERLVVMVPWRSRYEGG